jgi:phosphatidylglycerol lysyltransferase
MKRRWVLWLLGIAFVWLIVSRFTEIEKLAQTLAQGRWQWVLGAALLQVVYYIVYAGLYQSAFDTVDVTSRIPDLLPVVFASLFVNVVAPTGGASGAALFVDDASRRGQSPARATLGTLLVLVADFSAFLLVLAIGMAYLFVQHDLKAYEVMAAVALVLMTACLAGVMLLGLWRPSFLRRLLGWVQRAANRGAGWIHRPAFLDEGWAEKNAAEFTQAGVAIATHPLRLARTLALALVGHLLDLAGLFTLFLAFRQPIGVGVLVAGYAVGILFWIVSPTPQGIGVVEGVMALVYTSLDVPAAAATVIALAFRGLSFWVPLAIGFVVLRRVKAFRGPERTSADVAGVRAIAMLAGIMGVVNILSAVTPSLSARLAVLTRVLPLAVRQGGRLTAALAGFALLLLAGNLWRRKRAAWLLTLIILLVSAASHIVKGLDYEEAGLSLAMAVWLVSERARFHARSDPPSVRQGLQTLGLALVFTLGYGAAGFYLLDRHFNVSFGLGAALRQTVVMFIQFYNPGLEPITGFGRYFADSIYVIGAATTGYALLMLIRPVLVRWPATRQERERARSIVQAYGRSSLAFLTLFEDKAYYFSPGGSVVAYAEHGRGAVALGDPIGPAEDLPAALTGFRDYCAGNDWQSAFYQTLPETLEAYRAAGYEALCVGHEGIVDLASFTLEGKDNKALRSALNRLTRLGHRTEIHSPPLPDNLLGELRSISDEWLTMVHGSEKRFSLGWFEDSYVRNCPVMVVHTPEGWISAFANVVPEYQRNEATIDLMRHRPEVENGTMDFLFVSLFEWARAQGYATFSLGLSSLSGVGEHADDPAVERAMHFIYQHVNQFYNFKGLHAFKEKYHPTWSPRYLIYPSAASLPGVLATMIRASSGDRLLLKYLRR